MLYCYRQEGKEVQINIDVAFDLETEVLVAGLGTAGSIATIAAAREGKKVLGVEPNSYMGGVGTGGGIHSYCHGSLGGLQSEIDQKCEVLGEYYNNNKTAGWHPDVKKFVLEEESIKENAELFYQTRIVGLYMEGNKAVGVQVFGERGLQNIKTHVIIDCSGDGEVCILAGCSFLMGREVDGIPQPYSFPREFISEKGHLSGANFDAGFVDPTNGDEMSKAIVHSQTLHAIVKYDEKNRYLSTCNHLGLREGRFIVGEDMISYDDLIHVKEKPDLIFRGKAFHDSHSRDWAFESAACQKWVTICGFWHRPTTPNVPYGAIVPKGVDGLLVAGRCVSMDHDAAQTLRMQRDMQKLGETAGYAASIAIDEGVSLKDISYDKLRTKILATGCLNENDDCAPPFLTDHNKIKESLATAIDGEGIWSAYLLGDAIKEDLQKWLKEEGHLSKNAAFALALMGDKSCLEVLRKMVREKDSYFFPDVRRAQERRWGAIFLLGELADDGIFDELIGYMEDPSIDFQTFTQSLVALIKIGDAFSEKRNRIVSAFEKCFGRPDFYLELELQVSLGDSKNVENYTDYVQIFAGVACKRWNQETRFLERMKPENLSARDRRFYLNKCLATSA